MNTVYPEKEAYQDAYDYYSQYVDLGYITESECEAYCQEYVEAYGNDNERMAILHADNDDDRKYWNANRGTYSKTTVSTDLYPYQANDSITNLSRPAFTLYHPNADGSKYLNHGIFGISQNGNGTVSFRYQAVVASKGGGQSGDYVFYESFDECDGTGGNDGLWSNSIASSSFLPDNEGWESTNKYGANQCARFGTGKVSGEATTPEIALNGEATLTFRAGAWKGDATTMTLSATSGTLETSSITIPNESFEDFTINVTGTGSLTITFATSKRFFLDEVKITKAKTDGIEFTENAEKTEHTEGLYDLSGRRITKPAKGIYIQQGRKIIVR